MEAELGSEVSLPCSLGRRFLLSFRFGSLLEILNSEENYCSLLRCLKQESVF